MNMRTLTAAALVFGWMGSAHAANTDALNAQMSEGVVVVAASMNGLAAACGHMSPKEVEEARAKQRKAAVQDMKMKPEGFDAIYDKTAADFQVKWKSGTDAQRKQSCEQVQKMRQMK